jgi:urease accessory protein
VSHAGRGSRHAAAELSFRRDPEGATYIAGQRAGYPFHLCRLHRYEGDPDGMATLYLQSVSGGIYDGDDLRVSITAEPQAQLHLTTQASTIVQRMPRGAAEHRVTIRADADCLVEYMPDPMILFPEARVTTRLEVEAHESAVVIACDSFLAHDPTGAGAPFGWLRSTVEARRPDGRPLFSDRYRLSGDSWMDRIPGLGGLHLAQAALIVLHPSLPAARLVEAARVALATHDGIYAGASALPNSCGAGLRILAPDGAALRAAVGAAWTAVRVLMTGRPPQPRRK